MSDIKELLIRTRDQAGILRMEPRISTRELKDTIAEIERLERELAAKTQDLADVARVGLGTAEQLGSARAEAEALRTALAMMYDKWVDGDDCYEEPDTFSGFLGKAFQLSITEEDHVISLIGKDCPTRAIDAAIAREGM